MLAYKKVEKLNLIKITTVKNIIYFKAVKRFCNN